MADRVTMRGSDVRVRSLLRAMEAFRTKRRATQAELCALADLHPNTVGRYTKLLQEGGWIKPAGFAEKPHFGCTPIVWEWVA